MAQPAFAPIVESKPPAPIPVARPRLVSADAVLPYLRSIDESGCYSNFGPLALDFERRLAERLGPHARAVTTSNGTSALALTLEAVAPGGGLCIMPSWTFAATPHAAMRAGLTPWFIDVKPDTWMLDPAAVSAALSQAPGPVGAVTPVAPFGRMPDLEAWATFSRQTGVPVVVDAAAAFDGLKSAPVPCAVSLHATKALGVGEGGYVAAEDPALVDRIRQLSAFGFRGKRIAERCATNAKMSEYAAAVGHAGLDAWTATRVRYLTAAQRLRMALIDTPRVAFQPGWGLEWISSVCVVRLPEGSSAAVAERLQQEGVDSRRWWSEGCHAMPAFADCPRQPLHQTEKLAASTLGIPFSVDLTADETHRIASALADAVAAL